MSLIDCKKKESYHLELGYKHKWRDLRKITITNVREKMKRTKSEKAIINKDNECARKIKKEEKEKKQ